MDGQHAELDPTPGGVFAVDIDGHPVRGEYVEVDPPHRVVVTWGLLGSEQLPAGSSRVEFRLTAVGASPSCEPGEFGRSEFGRSAAARLW